MPVTRNVFVAGGTGYIGRHLIPVLLERGHQVTAISRPGSERKLPAGCRIVTGNVLDRRTFEGALEPGETFVQLTGVPHPSPAKAKQFPEIDGKSAMEAIRAARDARLGHFVYVSVAHPAPMMREYIAVRTGCEAAIRDAGLNATILRPWYVLGPGHLWPHALRPFYWLAGRFPLTAEGARRLGLVTIGQMTRALVRAVESHVEGITVLDVPGIRNGGRELS